MSAKMVKGSEARQIKSEQEASRKEREHGKWVDMDREVLFHPAVQVLIGRHFLNPGKPLKDCGCHRCERYRKSAQEKNDG